MSSLWHQEPSGFSPCMEIDSSSARSKERLASPAWLKQEQDQLRVIKWEGCQTAGSADALQDDTPSSAVSGKRSLGFQGAPSPDGGLAPLLPPAASHVDGLPPRVLLTITKLQCMLESKQERIAALERQVEDLVQDRKFLRSQIENLTSSRSMQAFAPPAPEGACLFAPQLAPFPPTSLFSGAFAQFRSPARRSTRKANRGNESGRRAARPTAARPAPRLRNRRGFRPPRVNTGGRSATKRRNDRRRRRTTAGREVASFHRPPRH